MEYISIQETARKWNMSKRRVQVLCKDGRLKGAKLVGNMWLLPDNLEKPSDARRKAVKSEVNTDNSSLKAGIKRLLRDLYRMSSPLVSSDLILRNSALAAIATELASCYVTETNRKEIFEDLGYDLEISDEAFYMMLGKAEIFIKDHIEDPEIDQILSWSYQYSYTLLDIEGFSKTQFFTEQYMIRFLMHYAGDLNNAHKIVDPCCGGGNFLLECMDFLVADQLCSIGLLSDIVSRLYGYDIDESIVQIASVNIKIKCLSLLNRYCGKSSVTTLGSITPQLFVSEESQTGGSLYFTHEHIVRKIGDGVSRPITDALGNADFILTNPPFETIKGMDIELKDFLKNNYSVANCDTCAAFIQVIYNMLNDCGTCGIVTQNSWMFLDSFRDFRMSFLEKYRITHIFNLGSGAFCDLNGEKANVSLMLFSKNLSDDGTLYYAECSKDSYLKKIQKVSDYDNLSQEFAIRELRQTSGEGFDFAINKKISEVLLTAEKYSNIAIPMQGTSTGNSKELVDYFWKHTGDSNWKLVSKGGGYSRWQGLNHHVVKWGEDGEFIKNQSGSAIRNSKYFDDTFMVFSDTGTSGLNVRILLPGQLFIASGPGIRIKKGNPYAQLSYLNSRVATYYIRRLTPKLTIAAGYIGKIPVNSAIYDSVLLEKNARLCIDLKQKLLCCRPTNYEYDSTYLNNFRGDMNHCAFKWFMNDLKDELLKLELEAQTENYITEGFAFEENDSGAITDSVGNCACKITGRRRIDCERLDGYIANLLNQECMLKRTRPYKNEMGCDGILEYISRDLSINPEYLVSIISENESLFPKVTERYRNLLLHNEVLELLQYRTDTGIGVDMFEYDQIEKYLSEKYPTFIFNPVKFKDDWNKIHNDIFHGFPILYFDGDYIRRRVY